jgi:hypothetical protein
VLTPTKGVSDLFDAIKGMEKCGIDNTIQHNISKCFKCRIGSIIIFHHFHDGNIKSYES